MLTHLTSIELEQFKCFRKLVLPLRPMTLLTGRNASGTSTVMQALVLLHKTTLDAEWSTDLHLDGSLSALGSAADVIDKVSGHRSFGIVLGIEDGRCGWTFASMDRRSMSMPIETVAWSHTSDRSREYHSSEGQLQALRHLVPVAWSTASQELAALAAAMRCVQYISAERLGPRETYPLVDPDRRYVGSRGQNAPALLHWLADERIAEPYTSGG